VGGKKKSHNHHHHHHRAPRKSLKEESFPSDDIRKQSRRMFYLASAKTNQPRPLTHSPPPAHFHQRNTPPLSSTTSLPPVKNCKMNMSIFDVVRAGRSEI